MSKHYYSQFCTGCGLCDGRMTEFKINDKGEKFPEEVSEEMNAFCNANCPMGQDNKSIGGGDTVWGDYKSYYCGFSTDSEIRFKASSGGIITSLCLYLLEKNMVDAIIHTTYVEGSPTENRTVVSTNREELISRCGSRYSESSPLKDIDSYIDPDKRYAFAGKPCDVSALRKYVKNNPGLEKNIKYMFSFFCAGTPTPQSNAGLLKAMDTDTDRCKGLVYRGNGWPGYVTATDTDGTEHKMDYGTAWMTYLGRDIRYSCKFCFDSIGEMSDVSCGDYWHLDENNKPDFTESDGVNCIFGWTDEGADLLNAAMREGYICLKEEDIKLLKCSQPNHANRRATALSRLTALWIMGKKVPHYRLGMMMHSARFTGIKAQLQTFKGTVSRIKNNRL